MNKKDNIQDAIKEAKASLSIEGIQISVKVEKLIAMRLSGEISESEFKQLLRKKD